MPHEAYHQALMLAEIVDKLQQENQQQKLTIKRMKDELDNIGSGSHQEVQAQLLKEAKQRGDDLQEQVLDLTHKNKEFKKYADKLVAHAIESPSHEVQAQLLKEAKWKIIAQWKIIADLRADKKVLREQLDNEHLRIKSLEKQREQQLYEAYRTIDNQKCLMVKYRKRLWFVTHKLLLAEQITRLQDYIDSEE